MNSQNININIEPKDYQIVINILCSHLKADSKVYAFGSRTKKLSRKYSDLDLLVYADKEEIFKLNIAFEESSLGFNVDVIDASTISEAFLDEINSNLVLLNFC